MEFFNTPTFKIKIQCKAPSDTFIRELCSFVFAYQWKDSTGLCSDLYSLAYGEVGTTFTDLIHITDAGCGYAYKHSIHVYFNKLPKHIFILATQRLAKFICTYNKLSQQQLPTDTIINAQFITIIKTYKTRRIISIS